MALRFLLAFLVAGFCSCASSSWVRRSYEPKGGTIGYLNEGADFVIRSRRKDAFLKMTSYCSPQDFRLVDETYQDKYAGTYLFNSGYAAAVNSQYMYINFICSEEQ